MRTFRRRPITPEPELVWRPGLAASHHPLQFPRRPLKLAPVARDLPDRAPALSSTELELATSAVTGENVADFNFDINFSQFPYQTLSSNRGEGAVLSQYHESIALHLIRIPLAR